MDAQKTTIRSKGEFDQKRIWTIRIGGREDWDKRGVRPEEIAVTTRRIGRK